nr:dual specificity mitogen activated protein [Hymenolepis microstoma]
MKGKLAKFFSKLSMDKVPKSSEGRRLNEPKREVAPKIYSPESPLRATREAPSEVAMKASEAALGRIAAQKTPHKTSIQRRIEAENAQLKKQIQEAEQIASQFQRTAVTSDTGGALKKVLFSCSKLLGDEFTDSYDKVDAEIVKALLEEAQNDPASAYTLLVIRNIASSPFPADVDPNNESTPDINVFREKRKNNLETIIRNLIEHPDKENFRRLKMSNKLIAELLQLEYGQKFLETCGFIETEENTTTEDGSVSSIKLLVFPAAPSEEQTSRLKEMLELLKSGEKIFPELVRGTTVFQATGSEVREFSPDDLPPEFFAINLSDFRRMRDSIRQVTSDKPLLTKASRDRLKKLNRRTFRYTLIRVRLPQNNLLIQATFATSETVNDVRMWLSGCLVDPSIEYILYAPPGTLPSTGNTNRPVTARVPLDECGETSTLLDLNLFPSVILNFALQPIMPPNTVVQLLPELEARVIPLPTAIVVGGEKVVEVVELQAILSEDSCRQTQEELSESVEAMPIVHQLSKLPIENTEIKNNAISETTTITVAGKLMEIRFGELTLVKRLGSGHFGHVSLMRVVKRGEVHEFAVKELTILNTNVRASRVYLESEFGIRMSDCQFAVITYGVVAMGDCVRILMETMDSSVENLKTRLMIKKRSWPEYTIAFITKCVVKGLEFLRKQGIQHRDVKPTNMLVNKLGCVKICDYGVAQQMKNDKTDTKYVGTYSYMAPERLTRQNANKGFRIQSDVWSLGLSVYYLSTGFLPFSEKLACDDLQRYFEEHKDLVIPVDNTFTTEQSKFLVACLKLDELERPDYITLLQMDFLTEFEKVHRKITSELNKFRLELEADNVGIATKIEHRVRTYLNIKDPAQKHHAARFYGVNRNTYRRNPFASDQDKRYFVHKKRMYPLSGLTNGRTAIRHPKTSSFASEESSLSIISDGPNRLLPSSDNLQQISGADSINSIDPNLQDSEFGPFTSEIGDEFLAEDEEDDPIQFDALPRRSRFIGTPQMPSTDNSRLHRGGHSPFVNNSDTENLGGGVNTGNQIIAEFQPSSIDEMLVNTSTPSPIVKSGESPRWISGGTPDNANTNKSRRTASQHSRRPSQISVPEMTSDDVNSYHYANISQSPSRLLQQQQQDSQDISGGASSDPDNRKYCFCRDVSYGEMIACDAPNCPVEWFHYPCVNLSVAPKGKWICPLCSCNRFSSSSSSSSARKRIRR